jgi:heme-degrading monooxygenase HmoA
MVITILEAYVPLDKLAALEQAYQAAIAKLDPGIKQTFLLHSATDSTLWRIVTVWRSREALEEVRQFGQTPRGVLMFRAAGAEPTLSVFDVAAHASEAE